MFLGLSYYFILMDLYIYSFLGWIYESIYVSIREKKPVNRGFLVGPLLPLYGFGGTLVYVFLRPVVRYPSLLFLSGMILATFIEYLTSWVMEKLFHAQWWDYSDAPYNLEGRIALIPSMFWGILTLVAFDFLQPGVSWLIHLIPQKAGTIALSCVMIITLIDFIYTVITTINFSKQLENIYGLRDELINQLQETQFSALLDILSSKTQGFSEKKDALFTKLAELKAKSIEADPSILSMEERIKGYLETHLRFQKLRFIGNRRRLNAFPTMRFIPKKNKKLPKEIRTIQVKELIERVTNRENRKWKKGGDHE